MWSLFPNLMTLFVPQVHIISLALSNASCCQSRAGEQLLSSTNAVDMYSPQVYLFLFLKLLTTSSHCTEWKFPWTVCPSALTGHLQSKARLLVIARTHHYTLLRPATAPTNRHKTAHTIYICHGGHIANHNCLERTSRFYSALAQLSQSHKLFPKERLRGSETRISDFQVWCCATEVYADACGRCFVWHTVRIQNRTLQPFCNNQ